MSHAIRKRRNRIKDEEKIKVAVIQNPRRRGTEAARTFERYWTGMTVGEARQSGLKSRYVRRDRDAGLIELY